MSNSIDVLDFIVTFKMQPHDFVTQKWQAVLQSSKKSLFVNELLKWKAVLIKNENENFNQSDDFKYFCSEFVRVDLQWMRDASFNGYLFLQLQVFT